MGKISALLLSILFVAVILAPMINRVQAGVNQWTWLPGYVYRGYDPYYDPSYNYPIIAFLNGTTATLKVPVYNGESWMGPSANITAVSLVFDTGYNVTLSTVVNITLYTTKYFDISFTADTNILSNLWAHTYTIYVDMQDNSGTKYDDYWAYSWSYYYPQYKFVVYTPEQKDIMDLEAKIDEYEDNYEPEDFQTIEGRLLAVQALVESDLGYDYYMRGNFTEAQAHYETAIILYEQAFDAEESKGTAMEDAQLDAIQKEANATVKQADAAMLQAEALMNQAYGYLLLGLGFVLIGIGAIVYGLRKPKTA